MKFFTKQEKILAILLSVGLVSGISVKYFKGGFEESHSLELIEIDETIQEYYEDLNSVEQNSIGTENFVININTATKLELIKLSGVGPALAERIISKRKEIGKFNTLEELKLVKGIGEKLYQKNSDKITIEEN